MNWLLAAACAVILTITIASAQVPKSAIPVHLTGDWRLTIGPGTIHLGGSDIALPQPVALTVTPPEKMVVTGEAQAELPVFNPNGGWRKGLLLKGVRAQECSTTGLLVEDSLVVKRDTGEVLLRGTDYQLDPFWGSLGRLEGGALAAGQKVLVDYAYIPMRVDSIVALPDNTLRLIPGTPGVGAILPPALPEGAIAIVNLWHHGPTPKLDDSNLYPVDPEAFAPLATTPVAEKLLPRTLAKLRAGENVKIVAWGDSVTNGGGVGNRTELWYQNVFAKALGERFPQAKIEMITAAWGGRSSAAYMDAPRGGEKDFIRDVLEPKPDLITVEFVNDAGLSGEALRAHYTKIMGHLRGCGAEVILISPHLVRPDWMKVSTAKFDEDPRPYVRDLKQFAADNNIALADGSALWTRLWRQGIPYMTMEANSINHPDARGQRLFSDALMALFPEK
jgi:lysophospholipase L1-like esterase